jgi:hypothetical protein
MTAFTPMSAQAAMRVGARARAPADVVLEDGIARVEVALRSDPAVLANHTATMRPSLDERLLADEHAVADFKGLEMRAECPASDTDAVTKAAGQRAPCRAAHASRRLVLTHRVHCRELENLLAGFRATKLLGKRELIVRIRLDLPDAVNRANERQTRAPDTAAATAST